ncbi:hypothetical protein R3P38DRAFT_3599041, partial [Favolaschia claudopus]
IDDINCSGAHFRAEHILQWESGRDQPYVVGNEFAEGDAVLNKGTLKTFLARTASGGSVQQGDVEPDDAQDVLEQPPCPATVVDGVMEVDMFITGAAEA